MNRDLDDEPWPIPVLTPKAQQRERRIAMRISEHWRKRAMVPSRMARVLKPGWTIIFDEDGRPLHARRAGSIADCVSDRERYDDLEPIRVGPPEAPGPPPRRRWKWKRPMVILVALVLVAFVALTLFMCVPGPYGPVPG